MNYYARHIGDYHKKAGRLSMLQHGAYTLLMDAIYDREIFPTLDEAIDWVWASSSDEIEAITFVINKFFNLDNGVYSQSRMTDEIEHYQAVCETNAINGKKGGRPKNKTESKANKTQSVKNKTQSVNLKSESKPNESDLKPNQEPITNNQEPITNNQLKDLSPSAQIDNETIESDFDIFYSAGMVKKGRKQSLAKFKLLAKKNGGSFAFANMLSTDVKKRISSSQFGFDTLNPLTYLNNERWADEIKTYSPTSSVRNNAPDRTSLFADMSNDDCPFYGQEAIDHKQPIDDQKLIEGECYESE